MPYAMHSLGPRRTSSHARPLSTLGSQAAQSHALHRLLSGPWGALYPGLWILPWIPSLPQERWASHAPLVWRGDTKHDWVHSSAVSYPNISLGWLFPSAACGWSVSWAFARRSPEYGFRRQVVGKVQGLRGEDGGFKGREIIEVSQAKM